VCAADLPITLGAADLRFLCELKRILPNARSSLPVSVNQCARLPGSGISEIAVNASLAFIEGAKPQGEVEGALVLQTACTHTAAMAVLATFAGAHSDQK
jgi:hypothetical protein